MVGGAILCAHALVLTICQAAGETNKVASTSKAAVVSPSGAKQTAQSQKAAATVAQQSKPTAITGSYIPTKIKRAGRITDGPLNVIVIDQQSIEGSGATSVGQLLAREPGIRVRSP